MKKWMLKIQLNSDFCTATGESTSGLIHAKTALDNGIPYIPAKRIKGCLLESGRELSDNGLLSLEMLKSLFGKPGTEASAGMRVGDGFLCQFPGYLLGQGEEKIDVEDYPCFQQEIRRQPDISPALLEDIFTRRRTRTAMEAETGAARPRSLRTAQVVPGGIVFSCLLEGELADGEVAALRLCAKGLRHMGLGITRGLGEVKCTLEESSGLDPAPGRGESLPFAGTPPEAQVSLTYEIRLDKPVVLSEDGGGGVIPGSTLLGAMAMLYIKRHSLGEAAHQDEDFKRIFLRDGVKFGYGFLKKGGAKYVPCPRAIIKLKDKAGEWVNTLSDTKNQRGKSICGLVAFRNNQLYEAAPAQEIHFHHARPWDRGIGHALNDGGSKALSTAENMGRFFQYIALAKGQIFTGFLKGRASDIESLIDCLRENQFRLVLGKSKTAEYGDCSFRISHIRKDKQAASCGLKGTDWLVWLTSPLVYRNQGIGDGGQLPVKFLEGQLNEQLGKCCNSTVEVKKEICSHMVLGGYNSKWRLPAVPLLALAAGSSFYIKTGKEIEASQIKELRLGFQTGKGCGQMEALLWNLSARGEIFDWKEEGREKLEGKRDNFKKTHELTEIILNYQKELLERKEARQAALDWVQGRKELPPSSSIFMLFRLLRMKWDSTHLYEEMENGAKQISDKKKREAVVDFLNPCKDKSRYFMERYLEAAKWKAREKEDIWAGQ